MIWMLHMGRAILVASALYFIGVLVAMHPPFLTRGAVRTEAAAIAVSKHAFAIDPGLMRDGYSWQAWLDCDKPFERCRWIAGTFEEGGRAYTLIDPNSGKVIEMRMAAEF